MRISKKRYEEMKNKILRYELRYDAEMKYRGMTDEIKEMLERLVLRDAKFKVGEIVHYNIGKNKDSKCKVVKRYAVGAEKVRYSLLLGFEKKVGQRLIADVEEYQIRKIWSEK